MTLTEELMEQVVKTVSERLRQQTKPLLFVTDSAEQWENALANRWEVRLPAESEIYDKAAAVVAATLSLDDLFRVAHGMEHPLIQARLRGKPAFVCTEGMAISDLSPSAPSALRQTYKCYQRQACQYGIAFLPQQKILEHLKSPDTEQPAERCVLSEAKVKALLEGGQTSICLSGGSIVTPLARDFAKQHGFLIRQEG